jgi:2-hydroxychromene-2-carboxylate isomerase
LASADRAASGRCLTMILVYGDFNCPYSYLASLRVDRFIADRIDVEWRAVEHAPTLPVVGKRLDDAGQRDLAEELDSVRQLLTPEEEFAAASPSMLPNTAAANAGYAEAVGSGVGDDVRRLLFETYWTRGTDVGSVDALRSLLVEPIRRGRSAAFPLRESGFAVSTNRGPITTSAFNRLMAWRRDWTELATWTTPTVVVDGAPYVGVDGLKWLSDHQPHPVAA